MDSQDASENMRPAKRARSETAPDVDMALAQQQESNAVHLLNLPDGVLHHIFLFLPANALMTLDSVCRYFNYFAHRVAKEKLIAQVGYKQAARWRDYNWLQRLAIEETVTKFDLVRGEGQSFTFTETANSKALREIRLDHPGPRLLLSDVSTAQTLILRWKLQLRGNNAAEFGVVPLDMQDQQKALHKCSPNASDERATGFSSAITVGSLLPARLPIMKDTIVEILVTPREISFIVYNPEDGSEMVWQNNSTVARQYKVSSPVCNNSAARGPRELRLQLPNTYQCPVKLAVTAWQRAAFDVLHMLSPQELKQLQQERGKGAHTGAVTAAK
ncbi:hypothetical protein VOLCADRAFT_108120 [Volvox carteri f. nagariensis]|uniref:F-box domain-containing protein n=1 Tax=Volvox carteri f. nagariensis TaxID=3068 RepID=D8UIB8_VOLCA|nr:uncharacterized protein VOLCADRAFT_108120 [Volvox carteri f. nagariensis]EFJ40559.1 hypothetical protein VOLCADRAFT_108120 [Volvox carteri f. nagariensis]|eukprot:XP_002958409.1 hypothetical protein VOLCADRAFT_108120 [Volvox carteri f. nagariensis]